MALVGQTALLAFAYAIRSSAIWMIMTVGLVFAALVARPGLQAWRRRSLDLPIEAVTRCAVMMVFVATLFGISGLRSIYLTPPCGAALNAHVFWHNVFIGFSFHPEWGARFAAEYDHASADELGFLAAKKYVEAHHLPYQTEPSIWVSTPQSQSMTVEAMPLGSWVAYENVMRAAVFEFALRHPRYVLENYLIYQPLRFVRTLENMIYRMWGDLTWPKIAVVSIMLAMLAGLQGPPQEADALPYSRIAALAVVCFIMSASPAIIVYSQSYLIADEAYVAVALTAFCLVWALGGIFALLRRRALKSGSIASLIQ
jgi:hypothetical protein